MKHVSYLKFKNDQTLQDCISFRIVQISEAISLVDDKDKINHPEIPWIKIKGMRNRIVHDYGKVDFMNVYQTATKDISTLKKQILSIIDLVN